MGRDAGSCLERAATAAKVTTDRAKRDATITFLDIVISLVRGSLTTRILSSSVGAARRGARGTPVRTPLCLHRVLASPRYLVSEPTVLCEVASARKLYSPQHTEGRLQHGSAGTSVCGWNAVRAVARRSPSRRQARAFDFSWFRRTLS